MNHSDIDFEAMFWLPYGKRVKKKPARAKWNRLSRRTRRMIADHVPRFVEGIEKHYRPDPITYLNQERWLDEELPPVKVDAPQLLTPKEVQDDAHRRRIYHRIFDHYTEAGKNDNGIPLYRYGR
jgi:hypothetical protein